MEAKSPRRHFKHYFRFMHESMEIADFFRIYSLCPSIHKYGLTIGLRRPIITLRRQSGGRESLDESFLWSGGGFGISDRNVQPLTPHHPSTALLLPNCPAPSGGAVFVWAAARLAVAASRCGSQLRDTPARDRVSARPSGRSGWRAGGGSGIPPQCRQTACIGSSRYRRTPRRLGFPGLAK